MRLDSRARFAGTFETMGLHASAFLGWWVGWWVGGYK